MIRCWPETLPADSRRNRYNEVGGLARKTSQGAGPGNPNRPLFFPQRYLNEGWPGTSEQPGSGLSPVRWASQHWALC